MRKNESGLYEVEVDGKKYEFEKWGAEESTDVLLDLVAITGKPIGSGVSAFFGKEAEGEPGLDRKMDSNVMGQIIESLTQKVGENKSICKMLIKKLSSEKVLCEGAKINFNVHYQDNLGHMLKVVKAALEVQYGNFIEGFLGRAGVKVPGLTNRGPGT